MTEQQPGPDDQQPPQGPPPWQPPQGQWPGYQPPPRPRLMRASNDKAISGVCAGIARQLNLDVTLVRVLVAIGIVVTFPVGLIGYVVAWAVMPEDGLR